MKKILQASFLTLTVLCFSGSLLAQVTFSNQGALLGNTSGFSYEDCAVDMVSPALGSSVLHLPMADYLLLLSCSDVFHKATYG